MAHVVDTENGRDLGDITHPGLLTYYAGEGYEIDGKSYRGDDAAMRDLGAQIAGAGQPEPAQPEQPTGQADAGGLVQVSGDPLGVDPAGPQQ